MRYFIFLSLFVIFFSCRSEKESNLPKSGLWRGALQLDNDKEIPFLFNFESDSTITIMNGDERISIDEITYNGDSITIKMPVFEGYFKGLYSSDSITGVFTIPSLERSVPFKFKTQSKAERFKANSAPTQIITGNWEAVFSPDSEEDRYLAKGIFDQKGHKITGTFRTTTGDYRYLEGVVEKDSIKLSTFDGAHAFLFEAEIKDSVMNGVFYSGNHFKEPFTAKRNENFELPKSDSLTFLKEGFDKIEFSFPNTEGKVVSLADEKYIGKVTLVQIMGTWCPNCLDETKYFTEYSKNKPDNVEFISLAFEYAPTEEKAMSAIKRLKDRVGVPYPILLAQFGTSDKGKANEKLPMLNHVLSYPTTIFIDKTGTVRKIHTGFNGPATGEEFVKFKNEFEGFVKMLSEE